jgi:uncharacterized paraquat-inducible protein A
MADRPGDEIVALCRLADEVLRARGHDLGEWHTDLADPSIARTAVCRRCGLPVHVRTEHGLKGLAGAAVTTPCMLPARAPA